MVLSASRETYTLIVCALTKNQNILILVFQVHFKGGEGRGKRFLKNIKSKFGGDSKFSVRSNFKILLMPHI